MQEVCVRVCVRVCVVCVRACVCVWVGGWKEMKYKLPHTLSNSWSICFSSQSNPLRVLRRGSSNLLLKPYKLGMCFCSEAALADLPLDIPKNKMTCVRFQSFRKYF